MTLVGRVMAVVRRLAGDRSANIAILMAGSLTMLIGTAALGVDAGLMFLERRQLQGIADAAAQAAAANPLVARTVAERVLAANGHASASVGTVTPGRYDADPATPPANRFVAGSSGANAVRVVVHGSVPTFFARAITHQSRIAIDATATAARIDIAAYSLGSTVAAVDGGLANALLSGLAGTNLNLTAIDYNGLAAARVDVLGVTQALRTSLDLGGSSFAETLAHDVPLAKAVGAIAATLADPALAATVRTLAARLPDRTIRLSDAIDLGPLGSDVHADPAKPVDVDAASLLRAILTIGQDGHQISSDVGLSIPGLASTRMTVIIGARASHSPWLAISAAGQTILYTAQTRILLETRLLDGLPMGLLNVTVPIYLDLGAASARLTAVSCAGGRAASTASIAVTPSIGRAAIASVDRTRLADVTAPLTLQPARLAGSALLGVDAIADLPIGGSVAQTVTFDADDIAQHRKRSVASGDIVGGLASALIQRTSINARLLGTGLPLPSLSGATLGLLTAVTGPLDMLIDQATALAGVRLGQADTWIDGVRCGTPKLVA